ncbi:mitochondrial thiamine pyrophosphate carrier [Episyrphus balteatus]|uniref:mitochondrial thiamine pyrophosphate carrier n=1 Tax=Episyrphus balteatus TaxID=286459 RepID=UPI002486ABEE|nr:mitochondrial thiamine pyrophosphate carrier [Episyrphus balteatus]XP_055858627.1 mitochondrial thiamine pyrophosphate carrier [Episyrphus balteatus]XP_055858628.1 mitochondrial thiamine pyrophosphate carrier [Episyrphus balteatus]XP_055858629.1 mitochondrial thiamine pyrophosphate carrier [Episyrphus balteatus]
MTPEPPAKHDPLHAVKSYDLESQLKQIAGGATSSIVTRFIVQPFEVLKIRFQLQVEPVHHKHGHHSSKYKSFLQACRLIHKEEGLTAFWKGHNAGQLLSIVYGVSQFWSYEQLELQFSQTPLLQDRPNFNRFISGATSGAIATMVSMPFDVVRTRLVVQDTGSGYRNATAAIPHILRKEGVRGLYRGLGTSLIQIVPLVGANFAFYGIFNDVAANFMHIEDHKLLPTWLILLSGGVTGAFSKMAVYPLDFIKRRLQVQGFHEHRKTFGRNVTYDGIFSCIRLTLLEEGLLGFYKGMGPTLIKAGVSTALYFGVYEKMKQIM